MGSQYLQRSFARVPVGYQSLDINGHIIDVNAEWCSMCGYEKKDVIGRWIGDFLSEPSREHFNVNFALFKDVGMINEVQFEMVRKDGSVLNVTADGKVSYDSFGNFIQTHCTLKSTDAEFSLDSSYQNILNKTSVPVIVFSPDTSDIVDVNIAACLYYGYLYKDFIRKSVHDLNIEPREVTSAKIKSIYNKNEVKFRIPHRLADGTIRIIETRPNKLTFGGRDYILSMIIDVTDEVRNERKLMALLELSKKLLEPNILISEITKTVLEYAKELTGAEDGYVATIDQITKNLVLHAFTGALSKYSDESRRITFFVDANGDYVTPFGQSLDLSKAFYSNNVDEYVSSDNLQKNHLDVHNFISFPVYLQEQLVGHIALVNSPKGFNDADMQVIQEISTIFALAVKGQMQLAEEYKFQEIFDSIVEGIAIFKPVGNKFIITDMNKAGCKITGYSADDIRGKPYMEVFPGATPEVVDIMQSVSKDGQPRRVSLQRYSDQRGTFVIDGYFFRMPTGFVVCLFRDLTELHTIQSELKELNENLLERVETEVGIRRRQEQIIQEQKKLADLGQMINAIAHQWRQPINALGLYSQEIVDLYEKNEITDAYIEEFGNNTMKLISHLSGTIDDFRCFFISDKEKDDFEVLNEVMSLMNLFMVQFNANDIKVTISCECLHKKFTCENLTANPGCEHSMSMVKGYRGEFRQVILNLLHNASDAIKESMKCGAIRSGEINIRVFCDDKEIRVEVGDNGSGIDDNIIDMVFNPYFTTKPAGKGTGIGLYMSKVVIEDHMGGKLSVYNNKGAVFVVTLYK
ncbi:multi-sensor signal transduction histidine kinase [Denitrovibrio acetiphilus DSM 12809]|uniref:histidine kinase n=1 Tax=Denitrovibrio acetiphilus (strain DSM 12809 / NBRC 114555 / N2460) TaxID=522772 RepID=D4H1X3_DENA2|nr:PAS domain S-box protein [Denitrovibrio acetiphilus]ADD66950.1 multi-sensor signal transduction histidine kinase [Denitrovibrio acetiphilus DSM 12809]